MLTPIIFSAASTFNWNSGTVSVRMAEKIRLRWIRKNGLYHLWAGARAMGRKAEELKPVLRRLGLARKVKVEF